MVRFGRVLLFSLLALWLPATLHCKLEAAGIFDSHCSEERPAQAGEGCTADVCPTVEDGLYKDSSATFAVAAPAECHGPAYCGLLVALERLAAEPGLSFLHHAPPPELTVRWQFITRAAPPARAPSLHS